MAAGTISTNVNDISVNLTTTGKVSSNPVVTNVDDSVYEKMDYSKAYFNTMSSIKYNNFVDLLEMTAATGAVVATSMVSGIAKLGEKIVDCGAWVVGTVGSGILKLSGDETKAKEFEQNIMDFIATDFVADYNKKIYEGNEFFKAINEKSNIKYDSETASKIQKYTSEAVLIAGATAATVVTGGATAPMIAGAFAAGFAVGAGGTAEDKFKDEENRNFWKDSGEIALDGLLKGASTASVTKAASSAILGIKDLASAGLKKTIKGTLSAFNKDAIKSTIKNSGKAIAKKSFFQTFKEADFYLETLGVLSKDVKSAIKTGELEIGKMLLETGGVLVGEYIANLTGGILADSVKKIDNIKDIYADGQVAAKEEYNAFFKNFREHADGHSFEVTDYAKKLAQNFDDINVDEMTFAAMTHDLGMKGGYSGDYTWKDGKFINLSNLSEVDKFTFVKYSKIDSLNDYGVGLSEFALANTVRKNHPLNSALSVLTEDVVPDGLDRDTVALLAMSHSKSTSGIQHMDNKTEWEACVDKLESALEQYNYDNGTNYSFNSKKMKEMIGDSTDFKRLQNEALLIRDADAMSDVTTKEFKFFDAYGEEKQVLATFMQDGNYSVTENTIKRTSYNDPIVSEEIEADGLIDSIYTKEGQYVGEIDNGFSKRTHAGELNVNFDSTTDGKNYKATIGFNEANQVPNASWHSIEERLGEINTYTNCDSRRVEIELPKEAADTRLDRFYRDELADYRKKGRDNALNDFKSGKIDESTYKKQLSFYNNIKIKYVNGG